MLKVMFDGIVREATFDERAAHEHLASELPPPAPTPEERIAKLEAENAHLIEVLELILSGATEVDADG